MAARKFSTKHIHYVETRADHNFEWDVKYDFGFNGVFFRTIIRVRLTGDNPGAVKQLWDQGVDDVWNGRGFFADGEWTYGTVFDLKFVNSRAHHTVNVTRGDPRADKPFDMTQWYTTDPGVGTANAGVSAAHEFGHMFGLFDEYANGATYAGVTFANGLMADLEISGFERYFWTLEFYAEYFGGSAVYLVIPIRGDAGANTLTGGFGQDAILGLGGVDTLNGGSGGDWLHGGAGKDRLNGEDGRDQLFGGSEKDVLSGGEAADRLFGQDGDDTLAGGGGGDVLTGGPGSDKFIINTPIGPSNVYFIRDLRADDLIYLSGKIFTKPGAKVGASEFRYGAAQDKNDYFLYDRGSGRLYYDPDGSKSLAPTLIADLKDNAKLIYSQLKMFDAIESLDNLTISKSGGIEGFQGTYKAKQDVDYNWSFQAYSIPDSLRIWDNTGNYVYFTNRSDYWSGTFELRDNSDGLINIAVAGTAAGTVWDLSVSRAPGAPPMPTPYGDKIADASADVDVGWLI